MIQKNKKILFGIVLLVTLWIAGNCYASGDLRMKELKYQVQLQENGDMKVTENWRIEIEDTNTLFKTFEIDESKYDEITEVSVAEITKGTRKEFTQIPTEQYHVDKDCFYALENSSGKYEIAWGAHAENTEKIYQISYTVKGAVTNYQDCSELYWQFIGEDSEIPVDKLTGTILLPEAVTARENLKVWAHGPLNGSITIISNQEVRFEVTDLSTRTFVETRIVTTEDNVFLTNTRKKNQTKLASILEEEQKWADEANRKRQMQELMKYIFLFFTLIVGSILGIALLIKVFGKYRKILKENPKLKPEQELPYYRDIPDEKATPSMAGFLYYFHKGKVENNITKVVSATLLDLCKKGYLTIEVAGEKAKDIIITVPEKETEKMPEEEKVLYDFIEKATEKTDRKITMEKLQKAMERSSTKTNKMFQEIAEQGKKKEIENKNYDKELEKQAEEWTTKTVLYIIGTIFIWISPILALAFILAAIYSGRIASRFNCLTQQGVNELEKWNGLKRYMEDFSQMEEKSVPELILWEEYLIFATVFGIADKVLAQIKVKYPEMADETYLRNHGYTYLYLMNYSGNNASFINTIDKGINFAYQTINYSSGSGSGGGFSGGGGRRWRRRPEWAEDEKRGRDKLSQSLSL